MRCWIRPAMLVLGPLCGCSLAGEPVRAEAPSLTVGAMVFRRISPKLYGADAPDFYLLETEVTNEQYQSFLLGTGAQKDETPPREPEDSPRAKARRQGYESDQGDVFQVD